MAPGIAQIARNYTERGELLQAQFHAWRSFRHGYRRWVIAVTNRRLIAIRCTFWRLNDGGLMWADPVDEVALRRGRALRRNGYAVFRNIKRFDTGNVYVQVRRATGRRATVVFYGEIDEGVRNAETMYALIPSRF